MDNNVKDYLVQRIIAFNLSSFLELRILGSLSKKQSMNEIAIHAPSYIRIIEQVRSMIKSRHLDYLHYK
jgi:hypothetical protein